MACNRCILDPPPNPLKLPCGGAVPPFYLFPTGQAFHVLCAAAEVVQYGGDLRAKEVSRQGRVVNCLHGPGAMDLAELCCKWHVKMDSLA